MIAMPFGNLAQHIPQRYAQGRGDCFEQFRGCLLLPTLNFGEVTQGHLRLGRDLAQGSTLALANAAQNIAEFAAQQRGFTPCLSILLL